MPRSSNNASSAPAAPTWLYGPWLDLTLGCGAWSAPLLLLSYFSIASSTRAWSVAFYGLALLFNYPHYMATIYRAYHRTEDFQKYRFFTIYTTALILLTIFLSHVWLSILPWIFTLYLTWSPWHYSGQNYGLFMMFARRAGANPDKDARGALYGAFIASYLVLFAGFHAGRSSDPLFLSLAIPALWARWAQLSLSIAFLVLSVFGWSRLAKATGWRKLVPCMTLFSSQFLWFLLPSAMSLIKGIAIPQSRYSSGVLAIMHSAQYLWITSFYARRENSEAAGRSWRPRGYFAVLIAGGIALFVPGPWLASRIFHHDFAASFLIFTALVNLHHFILDGAIWKLRDGRIASLLLNSRDRVSSAASQATGRLSSAWSWLCGASAGARSLRVTAALLLLCWGTVEQVRHYLALRSELRELRRAEYLDSFDSQLQTRLARRALQDGHAEQAEAAWKKALQSNPTDMAAREGLLRLLIEHNRFDEAFDLTEASLHYSPSDANLLIDRGLLAMRKGQHDLAAESWQRALAIDPAQFMAHLYLATELDHENKASEAAAHYKDFLEAIARQPAANRPEPEKTIAIVLRMADCETRASQKDEARRSYQLAAKLAAQTKQEKLESIADVNQAALEAADGKVDSALQLYQQALRIDDSLGDKASASEDLLAYGRFLSRSGFSPRLAYACFVKSVMFADLHDSGARQSLAVESQELAKRLGPGARDIRRDPDPALREALGLKPSR